MVTGSHIPDDRNGIKFHTPSGEILKHDEAGIKRQQIALPDLFDESGMLLPQAVSAQRTLVEDAERLYVRRFLSAFPDAFLKGKRIGVYGHSAVGREILCEILRALGAEVVRLGFSDTFIPVDTEAIRPVDVELAAGWAQQHTLMAIVSTDGDSDRPLVGNENGVWPRGDMAGILCTKFVGADVVVTPVSSNTAAERSSFFPRVARTHIGSPFVIEAMQRAVADSCTCESLACVIRTLGGSCSCDYMIMFESLSPAEWTEVDQCPAPEAGSKCCFDAVASYCSCGRATCSDGATEVASCSLAQLAACKSGETAVESCR